MRALWKQWQDLRDDARGITAIEYALITALLVVVIVTGITTVDTELSKAMGNVTKALSTKLK